MHDPERLKVLLFMEVWKDVKGYEGYYQVSNLGRIKSLSRKVKNHSGFKKVLKEKILKVHIGKTGYYVVDLKKESQRKTFKIHRLIALHFIKNPNNKKCINHINGVKTDNSLKNLEWCTIKENNNHAIKKGLVKNHGVFNKKSKFKEQDVIYIKNSHERATDLAKKFNVSEGTIYRVRRGETYKSIK